MTVLVTQPPTTPGIIAAKLDLQFQLVNLKYQWVPKEFPNKIMWKSLDIFQNHLKDKHLNSLFTVRYKNRICVLQSSVCHTTSRFFKRLEQVLNKLQSPLVSEWARSL